jgi:hypothetical protein
MFELAAEHYASLTPLFESRYVGAEVAGAVLAGNTQGKVFVSAPDDFRAAFVYDNGFCVLGGPAATPEFATSCLQCSTAIRIRTFSFSIRVTRAGCQY